MVISFIKTHSHIDSSVFKTLLSWRFQLLIIFLLFCLLILFCWWKQYIKNSNQKLVNDYQQSFETLTVDTIRKIPLQTSASKRRMLISKPLKINKKKSSTISSSISNQSRRTVKTGQPAVGSSSTIKISLVVSKENNDHKDAKHIDQTLSNISLLTIHGIDGLKSKHTSRLISLELPSTNNKTENTSPNNKSKQTIAKDFENKIQAKHNKCNNDQES